MRRADTGDLEWLGLDQLAVRGFAFVRPVGSDLLARCLVTCDRFFELSVADRDVLGAYRLDSIFGYFPAEQDLRTESTGGVPYFDDQRARGYRSFDFLLRPSSLRAPDNLAAHALPPGELGDEIHALGDAMGGLGGRVMRDLLSTLAARDITCETPLDSVGGLDCSMVRLLDYPCSHDEKLSKLHTDYEFFSLIAASEPGLEVQDTHGETVSAFQEGWFAVVLGDMAEACTGGKVLSAPHRVRSNKNGRQSVVYFYGLPYDFSVVYREREVVFGQHLLGRLIRSSAALSGRMESGELTLDFPVPRNNPFRKDSF